MDHLPALLGSRGLRSRRNGRRTSKELDSNHQPNAVVLSHAKSSAKARSQAVQQSDDDVEPCDDVDELVPSPVSCEAVVSGTDSEDTLPSPAKVI